MTKQDTTSAKSTRAPLTGVSILATVASFVIRTVQEGGDMEQQVESYKSRI
ncbi:MAG: hypothetical protein HKN30_10235 [Sulfitobacter sp.]|nr:hypothetical protein [Sulfitobacter sp.]